jgi:hypothetical protein
MPKGINIKSLDISTAKKGQLTIKSPALANALLKDANKTLAGLQPGLGNVSLAQVELDDAGRVVIKNAAAANAIKAKMKDLGPGVASLNILCGVGC